MRSTRSIIRTCVSICRNCVNSRAAAGCAVNGAEPGSGEILTDASGRSFALLRKLGEGGFGAVYLARMCVPGGCAPIHMKLRSPSCWKMTR